MALPQWPSGLPHAPFDFSVEESARPGLESEMQSGIIKTRRTATVTISTVTYALRFTSAQFQTFKVFVGDTLGNGAAEFEMPVWNGAGCSLKRVRIRDGGKYTYQKVGSKFDVSFQMDVWAL